MRASFLFLGGMALTLGACGDDGSGSDDSDTTTGAGNTGTGASSNGGTGADAAGGSGPGGGPSGGSGPGEVLFADDFESGSLDGWDDKGGEPDKYAITTDPTLVHSGSGALDMTIRSDWSGGQLNKWFPSVDEIHISMDIMFDASWDQSGVSSRHLMQLSGNHEDVMQFGPHPDSSFGQAGVTPDGTDFFWIHLTPWNDDEWHVGMAHPNQSSQWGDSIITDTLTTPGSYQHVVLHGRLNDLGQSNGFVRLTIDGQVALEVNDLGFRNIEQIVFNSAGFQAYYNDFPGTSHVYVDNVEFREGAPF